MEEQMTKEEAREYLENFYQYHIKDESYEDEKFLEAIEVLGDDY